RIWFYQLPLLPPPPKLPPPPEKPPPPPPPQPPRLPPPIYQPVVPAAHAAPPPPPRFENARNRKYRIRNTNRKMNRPLPLMELDERRRSALYSPLMADIIALAAAEIPAS